MEVWGSGLGFKERVLGLLVLIWMALRNTRSELCKGFGRTYTQLVISYKSPPKCFTSALYPKLLCKGLQDVRGCCLVQGLFGLVNMLRTELSILFLACLGV